MTFIVPGDRKLQFRPFFFASAGVDEVVAKLTIRKQSLENICKMLEGYYMSGLDDALRHGASQTI